MSTQAVRIVVAEDDYFVAQELKRCLRGSAYEIICMADDGEKAVEHVCELKPDVVLLDIKMPKMDGFEAALQIQEKCPTPVVFLTAYESSDMVLKASACGAGAYLTKPPKFQEIDRAITIAMARHEDMLALKRLNDDLSRRNQELIEAQKEISTLQGLLPICSFCKKIRDDNGYWAQLEEYITSRTKAVFSHGICPECIKKHYPEYCD